MTLAFAVFETWGTVLRNVNVNTVQDRGGSLSSQGLSVHLLLYISKAQASGVRRFIPLRYRSPRASLSNLT